MHLNDIDTAKFVSDMFTMLKKNNLVLDRDITMLVRGILIIEATLENLNPNLSLISVLLNHTSNEESEVLSSQKILDTGRKIVKNFLGTIFLNWGYFLNWGWFSIISF